MPKCQIFFFVFSYNKSMEDLNTQITKNLKREIEYSGKSKISIAKEVGISPATLSQYLSGRAQPTLSTLTRLCQVLGISADDILPINK